MRLSAAVTTCALLLSIATKAQESAYSVKISEKPFRFEVFRSDTSLLVINGVALQHFTNSILKERKPYMVWTKGKADYMDYAVWAVEKPGEDGARHFVLLNERKDSLFYLNFRFDNDKLFFDLTERRPPRQDETHHSRISVEMESTEGDSYLGMGMRFNKVNHKGTVVTNWCREVGVNLPPISQNGSPEGRDITYYPVPFFLNLKGYGFLLNSYYFSEFDFAATRTNTARITNYTNSFESVFFLSDQPLDIISSYQHHTGKYQKPAPWVFGVWAAASDDWQAKETGQEVNEEVLRVHRQNKIPLSAIFAEDWFWNRNIFRPLDAWTLNRKQYPDFEKMIADQRAAGVKHISYFLPYLTTNLLFKKSPLFEEAKKLGYFTKNTKGKPYVFQFAVWRNTQFDWTNPGAAPWFWNRFYQKLAEAGVDGWMNDFGEYTPYDAVSYSGERGFSMHNRYPLLWAQNADSFWKSTYHGRDFLIFPRSGYIGQQSNAAFHFTGDRNATYDELSGLGGQVVGITTAGISAHPNTSMDIGAYNCEQTRPMDKLMMFRWIEMGALVPVMRLHRGLPLCDHWRFDEDEETLRHWKKYAALHARLFPYIYTLAHQAQEYGWPMVRSLAILYPKDKEALVQDYQFMLGDRILSAPVITDTEGGARNDISKGRTTWRVYLPEGNWYHYFSTLKYAGGQYHEVPAAPGNLPMFVREGKIIPTYNREVDTFVQHVADPGIKDFEFVDESMEIMFFGYGEDTLLLWDDTEIYCARQPGTTGVFEVKNGHGRTYNVVFID